MSIIKTISEVPDHIFFPALEEINSIPWETVIDPSRSRGVFNSSKSIHIRGHKVPKGMMPISMKEWCMITECENNFPVTDIFVNACKAADWIYEQVNGLALGRIMIVRLESNGHVGLHVDPYDYFEMYSRFHIPFKTNDKVLFSGEDNTVTEHMPVKTLNQLNNRTPHQLINNGDDYRIHLIVDVAVKGGNQIF
jgi:hypothetical protein